MTPSTRKRHRLSSSLFFILLPVVCVLAMFSEVMLVMQRAPNRLRRGIDAKSEVCHPRNGFEDDCVMRRCRGVLAPRKRSVVGHQNARGGRRIRSLQTANNRMTGVLLIIFGNLLIAHLRRYRNRTMKIIRVCGAEARDGTTALGPGGSIF